MYTNKVANMYVASIYEEIDDISKNIANANSNIDNRQKSGEIAIPLDIEPDQMLYDVETRYSYYDFFGHREHPIVMRNNIVKFHISKEILLDTLCNLASDIKASKLYGIVVTSDDIRLNLFHPMMAYDFINNYDYYMNRLDEKVEIIIYRYANEQTIDKEELFLAIELIEDTISLVNNHSYKASTGYSMNNFNVYHTVVEHIRSQQANFGHINLTPNAHTKYIYSVLTPVQFLVNGIIFPYYGVIHSKKSEEDYAYRSIDFSPFRSGNLNSSTAEYTYADTCTGSSSNILYSSLMTLNYMNGSSTYYSDIITYNYAEYTHASILFSTELYKHFLKQRRHHVKT